MKTKIVLLNSLLLCSALSAQRTLAAETTKADVIERIVRSDSLDASALFERFSRANEAPSEKVLRRAADCARLARRCYENNNYVKAVRFADVFFSELKAAQNSGIAFTRAEQLRVAVLRYYVYERVLGDHTGALAAARECADLSGAEGGKWTTVVERLKQQSSQERIYSLSTTSLNQAYGIEPGSIRVELTLSSEGGCRVTCLSTGEGQYRIEKSLDLVVWKPVATIAGNQLPITVDDPATDTAHAFYRVVRISPPDTN